MQTLNANEIRQLQQNLLSLLSELQEQHQLGKSASDTVVLDQSKVGRLSRMDAMQQQKMAESSLKSLERRLTKIRIALNKFDEGDYSFCEECDDTIAFARLQIQPEAEFCIQCQSVLEAAS